MKRTIAALAAAATLTGGFAASAASAVPSTTSTPPASVSVADELPPLEETTARLKSLTGESNVEVVKGLYDNSHRHFGMVIDQDNRASFWVFQHSKWQAYEIQDLMPLPESTDGEELSVEGGYAEGLDYPIFIVRGKFKADGSANAMGISYDQDAQRWGQLVGAGDQLRVRTDYAEPPYLENLEIEMRFSEDTLRTHSMWGPHGSGTVAEQLADPIVRHWSGEGSGVLQLGAHWGGPFGPGGD